MRQDTDAVLARSLSILGSDESEGTILQRLCNHIHSSVDGCDWVGFYIVIPGTRELALGPYAGEPTDHLRIPFGRGICGQAAEAERTFVVDDVTLESNYLSCSPRVQSEVVIPVFDEGRVVGELDIDSHTPAAFGPPLRGLLERIASECGRLVAALMPT